ncbi:MAG: hypothetical protein J0H18_19120 [Rhizobiales bacterium]|nr:hypothetical protein [Hyphomicrobiales bacterium]
MPLRNGICVLRKAVPMVLIHGFVSPYVFLPPTKLLPNECYSEQKVQQLFHDVLSCGRWLKWVAVEVTSLAIMDGHHRQEVALRLGLQVVPCVLLDYSNVRVESRRNDFVVNSVDIISRARSGNLYPEKTTRHIFDNSIDLDCDIPISELRH